MSSDVGILAVTVILSGLAIVFLLLILLILCVEITSRALKRGADKTAQKPVEQAAKPAIVHAKAPAAPVAPVVQQGIEEETVAVISAAVYSCMESQAPGSSYLIKSINRATGGRPVWGFAGMQQNTRPF